MRIGTKTDLKTESFCGFWKLMFCDRRAIKLTYNCVCFTNPCINSFVLILVTREYHPKVLERLPLLQCISAHLQNTLPWASWETQYLNLFSVDFRSFLVARSRKPSKCELKALLRRSPHAVGYQFVRKKQTVHPTVDNSDAFVNASVTVFTRGREPFWLREPWNLYIFNCISVRAI